MCMQPIQAWKTPKGLTFKAPIGLSRLPDLFVPCGKCLECKETRRRDWIRRIICESWLHSSNVFITLTYDDAHLPVGGIVSKSDIQKFLKRLRNAPRDFGVAPSEFRYFIVSEYGKKRHRPHYHGILFGLDLFDAKWCRRFACLASDLRPIYTSDVLSRIWSKGFVSVDEVTPKSIAYVVKYISKDSDGFRLYSRGLGKGVFFNADNTLTKFGSQSYANGFVVFPVGDRQFVKGAIPKNIDRYLKLYEPSFADVVSAVRSHFCRCKMADARSLAMREDVIKIKRARENEKRKLDNDS